MANISTIIEFRLKSHQTTLLAKGIKIIILIDKKLPQPISAPIKVHGFKNKPVQYIFKIFGIYKQYQFPLINFTNFNNMGSIQSSSVLTSLKR